jgi:magnesium transporter
MEGQTAFFHSLMLPDLKLMLSENDVQGLKEFCEALHPAVICEVLEMLKPVEMWQVLSNSPIERRAELFEFLPLQAQVELVDVMGREPLSRLIEQMSSDDRVDLLSHLDEDHVESLFPLIAQAERRDIRNLLSYPDDSAGSIMTTDYATLPAKITVGEAMERLRRQAPDKETIYYIYITNDDRHLQGIVSLRKLIFSKPALPLESIIERRVISVKVDDDVEEVAQQFDLYGFLAMPVVDTENRLVGIITHDDATDVQAEAATEDAHMQGAIVPLEESYLDSGFLDLAWRRGKWLVILLGASLVTTAMMNWIITNILQETSSSGWLMMFIPLVMASGGNAGSQSATLIIRAIAVEKLSRKDISKILRREVMLGAVLGMILGVFALISASILLNFRYEPACVVALTVCLVVMIGTFTGTLLPIIFDMMGADPALMSNPLIAGMSDACGVITYFTIAQIIVGNLAAT